jgi:ribosome recycling factor
MQKSFDSMLHQYSKIRTGRASASILDILKLTIRQPTPLKTYAIFPFQKRE